MRAPTIVHTYLLLALLPALAFSCKGKPTETKTEAKHLLGDSTLAMLTIDTVRYRSVDEEVKLTGQVSFDENKVVKVFPFSSGQVTEVRVSVGDYVKTGQRLATIRSADIAGNYSDLSVAGNDMAIARRNMENAESLFKNGIASEKDFIEARENYRKAETNVRKIREQIQINGGGSTSADGTYVVLSPRNGYIVEKLINPGNFIRNDNASHMFTVGDISDVWVWANVFEADVSRVREGYAAMVTTLAYPDSVFVGKVDKLIEVLDPVTKVMKVRIVLPNQSGLLKPEMFANVVIRNQESRKALCVPGSAIITENGQTYVVVFQDADHVTIQQVGILRTTRNCVFISEGLREGERVITRNQVLVYNKLKEKQNR